MGCTGCDTEEDSHSGKQLDENGMPRGCRNNGTCSSGGCTRLGTFDWLANMQLPTGKTQFDIVEMRFKNSRKAFYRNMKDIDVTVGDVVVVEASPGYDVGIVSAVGELSRLQLQKKEPNFKKNEARQIMRHASQADIDKWVIARKREDETMFKARELAIQLKLEMKISDVEFQGDNSKAIFYYTAEGRVDFRQLIKDLADEFRIRIEMKQIGSRQEASRLGGIGPCGRELCCSTWLTDFRTVSTTAARYQQLSINPQKLAGQCGKLKCCLNFELDMYIEALKDFPSTEVKLRTQTGTGIHIKTDVFKGLMWYIHQPENREVAPSMVSLSPGKVKEIIELNKNGQKPESLAGFKEVEIDVEESDYTNIVGQDDLHRFDDKFKKKKKKKKRKPQNGQQKGGPSSNK
ncbi:MAG: hypothetical protein M9897_11215 [Brumimicrobium sp.]|nr:hypothetical protein [Brumimicrobium sp.]